MLSDIGTYLWSLAEHWAAFMTGGIPAAIILIIERVRRNPLSLRTFVLFLAFGLLAAAFQEHKQLNDQLATLKSTNQIQALDLKNASDQLAEVRRQLEEAGRATMPSSAPGNLPRGNSIKGVHMENGDTAIRFGKPPIDTTIEDIETKNVKHGIDVGIDTKKK